MKAILRSLLLVALFALPAQLLAQTTYTWNVASGDLDAAGSWSPSRTSPAANDILVFDGAVQPTVTVTNIPARETIGQLIIKNTCAVTFSSGNGILGAGTIARTGTAVTGTGSSFDTNFVPGDMVGLGAAVNDIITIPSATSLTTNTSGTIAAGTGYTLFPRITISGGSNALSIAAGSSLTISSTVAISLYLQALSTGSISGAVTFTTAAHRINVKDAGGLTFNSGSTFTQNAGFVGSVFTLATATNNNVVFASGSTFTAGAGSNPFGIATPNSKVVFNSGSLFVQTSGTPSFSGRTYADFQLATTTVASVSGGSAVSINNLNIVTGSTLTWGMTGILSAIKGNISISAGCALNFTGAGTTTLSGTTLQTISSVNPISIASGSTVASTNTTGISLAPNTYITVAGTLNLNGNPVTLQSTSAGTASIGAVTGTLSTATNVTAERYFYDRRAWRLIASPVSTTQTINQAWQEGAASVGVDNKPGYGTFTIGSSTANGFDIAGSSASLLTYTNNSGAGTFGNVANTNVLTPSSNSGYFLFSIGSRSISATDGTSHSATTLRSTGTVLTGNQPFPVNGAGFTLVGNPYPSAVDFSAVSRTGTVPNSFYAWDASLGTYGGYVLVSNAGAGYTTVPSPPNGASTSVWGSIIPSGAAIFVQSDGSTAGTITFTEASKGGTGSGSFLNFSSSVAATQHNLRMNLTDANAHLIDGVMESYSTSYSNDVNHDDMLKMQNFYENISLKREGKEFALERRSEITAKDTAFIKLSGVKAATYQLQIDPADFNEPGMTAYLDDAFLNTHTKLDLSTVTTVAFTVTGDAATYKDRFSVTFSPVTTPAIATKTSHIGASVLAYPNPAVQKQINLSFDGMPAGNYNVTVMNTFGQVMQKSSVAYNGTDASKQLTTDYSTGVYTVNIQSAGYNQSIKVIVP